MIPNKSRKGKGGGEGELYISLFHCVCTKQVMIQKKASVPNASRTQYKKQYVEKGNAGVLEESIQKQPVKSKPYLLHADSLKPT